MLQLVIPLGYEIFDDEKQEFIIPETKVLRLEHSLVSLSKWESKWCKPFFSKEEKTPEETIDYIKCMTITQNVNDDIYSHLTRDNIMQVNAYIEAPMTATTFSRNKKGGGNKEIITSELIYCWMIQLNIPSDYEKWHLNRLLTLIQVCNIKNEPAKKMSNKEIMSRNRALNAARKKNLNTRG